MLKFLKLHIEFGCLIWGLLRQNVKNLVPLFGRILLDCLLIKNLKKSDWNKNINSLWKIFWPKTPTLTKFIWLELNQNRIITKFFHANLIFWNDQEIYKLFSWLFDQFKGFFTSYVTYFNHGLKFHSWNYSKLF